MKRIGLIILTVTLVISGLQAQETAKFKYRKAVSNILYNDMGEALSRLEAGLTQAEIDKIEALILEVSLDEKERVLDHVKVMLESVKAADAVSAVDAELAKMQEAKPVEEAHESEADKPEKDLK